MLSCVVYLGYDITTKFEDGVTVYRLLLIMCMGFIKHGYHDV